MSSKESSRSITLSVVSHRQNALLNQLLEDIARVCADLKIEEVKTSKKSNHAQLGVEWPPAETDDVEANAAAKLARKPVDLLVVNDVSQPGAGFESDTNEVRIMSPSGSTVTVGPRASSPRARRAAAEGGEQCAHINAGRREQCSTKSAFVSTIRY